MVEYDESTNAREIQAVGIKRGLGGLGSKSQGLGHSVLVADEASMAGIVNGAKPLAGIELVGGRCGRRPVCGGIEGWWWGLNWRNGGKDQKLAVLPCGPGSSCWSSNAVAGTFGRFFFSGKCQRWGACCSRHPLRMLCPSGWITDTNVLVKIICQPRSANGPKPMRVWEKDDITWPCIAAGGRDGAEARVALATDLLGRPFATRTPMEGARKLRLATGAPGAK